MVRARAGFRADQRFWCGIEEGHQPVVRELRTLDHRSGGIQGDDVEHLRTDVAAEGRRLRVRPRDEPTAGVPGDRLSAAACFPAPRGPCGEPQAPVPHLPRDVAARAPPWRAQAGHRRADPVAVPVEARGKPGTVVSDNGTEFTSNAILTFADDRKIDGHCIAPGRPTQNAFIEGVNGRLRDGLLDKTLVPSLHLARATLAVSRTKKQHQTPPPASRLADACRVRSDLHPATGPAAPQPARLRASPRCPTRENRQNSNQVPRPR